MDTLARHEVLEMEVLDRLHRSGSLDPLVFGGDTMHNKVAALMDRAEIRDGFDIEFLLRRGIALPPLQAAQLKKLQARLKRFRQNDFKVKLGSILEGDMRAYYAANGFAFLTEKLNAALQNQ